MFPYLSATYIFEWLADVCQRVVPGYRPAYESGDYFLVEAGNLLHSSYAYSVTFRV